MLQPSAHWKAIPSDRFFVLEAIVASEVLAEGVCDVNVTMTVPPRLIVASVVAVTNALKLTLAGKTYQLSLKINRVELGEDILDQLGLPIAIEYAYLTEAAQSSLQREQPKSDITGLHDWSGVALLGTFILRVASLIRGQRVLELGCGGSGAGLVAASSRVAASGVVLSDYSEEVLALARHNVCLQPPDAMKRLQVRRLDWDAPPKDLGLFDVVIGSELLYYAVNEVSLLRCAQMHLKPGGVFVLFSVVRSQEAFERLKETAAKDGLCITFLVPRSILDWIRFEGHTCMLMSRSAAALANFCSAPGIKQSQDTDKACDGDDNW